MTYGQVCEGLCVRVAPLDRLCCSNTAESAPLHCVGRRWCEYTTFLWRGTV